MAIRYNILHNLHTATKFLAAKVSLADALVTIFMGATRVLRIVDVYGMQAIDTHHAVELVEYTVQIMDDVVAGIAHMAGVQTNAQLIGQLWALGGNALDNVRQFFKATAHLGALAGHGLKLSLIHI